MEDPVGHRAAIASEIVCIILNQLCRIALSDRVTEATALSRRVGTCWDKSVLKLLPEDLSGNALGIEAAECWFGLGMFHPHGGKSWKVRLIEMGE